ncbi:MAG: helix-turn-helix domain-containing protein [Robiginitomaculum sp.]|nr:helix-turn-helix domain-containing protein [Robiginitomaculum sp.]
MFSIGKMAARTGVKVPTIRYYEEIGVLSEPGRNTGNQRRYTQSDLERLSFIKHARDLGLGIAAIRDLMHLHDHPDRSCAEAHNIAETHLENVRSKLKKLRKLEKELKRITTQVHEDNTKDCTIIQTLADHRLCSGEH